VGTNYTTGYAACGSFTDGVSAMKTLLALSTLQTIGIVILLIHVLGDERAPAAAAHTARPAAVTSSPFASTAADEDRLRMIIREELAAQRTVQADVTAPQAAAARDETSERLLQERVSQQIEAYRAAGSISDAQMQELQAQIAQLDAASRKRMMSKLIRAMNAGDLKGRL
jgi:Skp family chaperone for outer membrane proteins